VIEMGVSDTEIIIDLKFENGEVNKEKEEKVIETLKMWEKEGIIDSWEHFYGQRYGI